MYITFHVYSVSIHLTLQTEVLTSSRVIHCDTYKLASIFYASKTTLKALPIYTQTSAIFHKYQ